MTHDDPAGAALALVGVTKTFGPARVLDDVDIGLHRSEIHELVGQNGSGKSTLIKVLSGFHRPDAGHVEIAGEKHALPLAAGQLDALGIAFVHQDLGLVDTASVVDNIRVGRFARGQVSRSFDQLHCLGIRRERAVRGAGAEELTAREQGQDRRDAR